MITLKQLDRRPIFNQKLTRSSDFLGLEIPESPNRNAHVRLSLNADCKLLRGENLAWLSHLIDDPSQTFDFCYIDPPYNTGQQFIYPDFFKSSNERAPWGRHTGWMEFMLPRLVAAHTLLKSHGIIAISIDDYEYSYLKNILDVVFGDENHIATLVVVRSKNGKGSKPNVAVNHEYVVLFGKSGTAKVSGLHEVDTKSYNKSDAYGHYKVDGLFRKKGDASLRTDRPNMYYPLYYASNGEVFTTQVREGLSEVWPVDSKGVERRWLWGNEKATNESWKLYASASGVIYVKNYNSEDKRVKLRSVLDSSEYLTDRATTEIKEIFGDKVFETPKPLALVRDLVDSCCTSTSGDILDFFAGTGTTAEAVHELNVRDGGARKTVLIEQDLRVPNGHVALTGGHAST
ncbi:site-specific DNA-methyltransferase, partial [Roseateles sp. PN1]|uniref:site-specific DNA-methyltransferase n=1 Tax=Roseateles sp. PN1 TaxID=3137372 RepID=UPI003139E635